MTFLVVENLRGYFISRPPIVMFMICLASFAIALISFAYMVRTRDLPNPDVTEDWNSFLTKFSTVEFCVGSATSDQTQSLNSTKEDESAGSGRKMEIGEQHPADILADIHKTLMGDSSNGAEDNGKVDTSRNSNRNVRQLSKRAVPTLSNTQQKNAAPPTQSFGKSTNVAETSTAGPLSSYGEGYMNVTLPLNVEIAPSVDLLSVPLHTVHLSARVSKSLLKLNGPGQDESILVSLSFPRNLTHDDCQERKGKQCSLYLVNTCVTFSGPVYLFPRYSKPESSSVCQGGVTSVSDYSYVRNMTAQAATVSSSWCADGSKLAAEFTFDDSLTVLLSQDDRSMINMHLMRTSYFLFVMVITLFCYAMVKGRPAKVKTVHVSYEKMSTVGP